MLSIIRIRKGLLAQCQDNVTELFMVLTVWFHSGTAPESHHEYKLSQLGTVPDVTIDAART